MSDDFNYIETSNTKYRPISDLFVSNPYTNNALGECKTIIADMRNFHHTTQKEQELSEKKSDSTPITVEHLVSNCGQNLYYIGVKHINEHDKVNFDPKNSTYETIKAAFNKYPVNAVVIETTESAIPTLRQGDGEPEIIAKIAKEKGIAIIGGEPTQAEILTGFKKHGYYAKDYMGLIALHVMPKIINFAAPDVDKNDLIACANSYFKEYFPKSVFPEGERFKDYNDFEKWYKEHGGVESPFKDTEHQNVAPSIDGTYFQKLGDLFGKIRAENIVPTIAEAVNKYKDVLVGYGRGHKDTDLPIVRAMLENYGETKILVPQHPTTKHNKQLQQHNHGR